MTEHLVIDPLVSQILLAIVSAGIISGLAVLSETTKWGWKKFLYTLGLAGIAALVIVEANGPITEGNVLTVFLEIVGASFLGNKLISVAGKLKGK